MVHFEFRHTSIIDSTTDRLLVLKLHLNKIELRNRDMTETKITFLVQTMTAHGIQCVRVLGSTIVGRGRKISGKV